MHDNERINEIGQSISSGTDGWYIEQDNLLCHGKIWGKSKVICELALNILIRGGYDEFGIPTTRFTFGKTNPKKSFLLRGELLWKILGKGCT